MLEKQHPKALTQHSSTDRLKEMHIRHRNLGIGMPGENPGCGEEKNNLSRLK